MQVNQIAALVEGVDSSTDFVVTPGLVGLGKGEMMTEVEIFNPRDQTLTLRKGTLIGQLHQIAEVGFVPEENQEKFFEMFKLDLDPLSEEETQSLKNLLLDFKDIFSMSSLDLGCTGVVSA